MRTSRRNCSSTRIGSAMSSSRSSSTGEQQQQPQRPREPKVFDAHEIDDSDNSHNYNNNLAFEECYDDNIEIEADPTILSSVEPAEVRRQSYRKWGMILFVIGLLVLAIPIGILVDRYFQNSQAHQNSSSDAASSTTTTSDSSASPTPSPQNTTARLSWNMAFQSQLDSVMSSGERSAFEESCATYFASQLEISELNVTVVDQSLAGSSSSNRERYNRWRHRRRQRHLEQQSSSELDLEMDVTAVTSLSGTSWTNNLLALVNSDSTTLIQTLQDQDYFTNLEQISAKAVEATETKTDDGTREPTVAPTMVPSVSSSSDVPSAVPTVPPTLDTPNFDTQQPTISQMPIVASVSPETSMPTAASTSSGSGDSNGSNSGVCNGLANLCSVPVNQVLFATLHNAHAAIANGFTIAPNHNLSLEDAVEAGYRGINVDIGKCNGEVALTHTYCFLGTRDPIEVFSWIDSWLDSNPNEVLLMPTQIDNEAGGDVTLDDIYQTLLQSGNVLQKLYIRNTAGDDDAGVSTTNSSSSQSFPTLQDLIDLDQRILFFPYNGQTCAELVQEQGPSACPDGFNDWFAYAAETRYTFDTIDEVERDSWSCQITRGDRTHPFFGVNVFLNFPSQDAASYLNSMDFLPTHLDDCIRVNNETHVNAVLVDFWDQGDVLQVVNDYNSQLVGSSR